MYGPKEQDSLVDFENSLIDALEDGINEDTAAETDVDNDEDDE